MKFRSVLFAATALMAISPSLALSQEVIMRRPLPLGPLEGGAQPAPTPTPAPTDGSDPEVLSTTYIAFGSCVESVLNVTCLMATTDGSVSEVGSEFCAAQNPGSSDYGILLNYFQPPSGVSVISPSMINASEGAACTGGNTRTTTGIWCSEPGVPICESFTYTYGGSGSDMQVIEVIDGENLDPSACKVPPSQSIEDQIALAWWGDLPTTPDFDDACGEPAGPPPPTVDVNQGFFVSNPSCGTEVINNPDGSTTINDIVNLNCMQVYDYVPNGGWSGRGVPDAYCDPSNNTPEERRIIADEFYPNYQDPDTIEGSCNSDYYFLGPLRVDFDNGPMYSSVTSVTPFPDGYHYSQWTVRSHTPFLCHKFRGNIFDVLPTDPTIMDVGGMIASIDSDCEDLLAAELAAMQTGSQCEQEKAWLSPEDAARFPACQDSIVVHDGYITKVESFFYTYTTNPPSEGQVLANIPPYVSVSHEIDVPRN